MSSDDPRVQRVRELMDAAEAALAEGDLASAEGRADELLALQFTGGFDILAQVRVAQDRLDEAIATLEHAVTVAPAAWPLWHRLGTLRSDAGRYDAACEAYARGMACPGADLSLLVINLAVVRLRAGDAEGALAACASIGDPAWALNQRQVRVSALAQLGRWQEVLDQTADAQSQLKEAYERQEDDQAIRSLALTCAARAEALLRHNGDATAARKCALDSLVNNCDPPQALAVVNEIAGLRSPLARFFRLTVDGRWSQPPDATEPIAGFMRVYDVIADDADEALSLAAALEPPPAHSLGIEEVEPGAPAPDELKGVRSRSPYMFYAEDDRT